MGATTNLAFKISADNAEAVKAFGQISKSAQRELKKAADALDDTRSAGKKFADALGAMADDIKSEMGAIESASAKLEAALGADFEAGSRGVKGLVQDLHRAGLSFEEMEADAEELAAALRKVDGIRLNNLEDGMRRVGTQTDKNRSVMANFAGNAAQDLPIVTGSMGALNVAVGQFAEYATEGDIRMGQFIKTAGAMAGLVAGLMLVDHVMTGFRKEKELDKKATEELTAAIDAGANAVEAYGDRLEEARKVEVAKWGGSMDLTDNLARLGIRYEHFTELVAMSTEEFERWVQAQYAAGNGQISADLFFVIQGIVKEHENYQKALEGSAAKSQVFGYTTGQVTAHLEAFLALAGGPMPAALTETANAAAVAIAPLDTLSVVFGTGAVHAGEMSQQARDLEAALISLNDTVIGQVNAQFALASAEDAAQEARNAYDESVRKAGRKIDAKEAEAIDDALRNMEQSYFRLAEAAGRAAVEGLGPAATEAEKAAAQNAAMKRSLEETADALTPGSSAFQAVQGWITLLGKIPMNLTTRIGATFIGGVDHVIGAEPDRRARGGPAEAGQPYVVGDAGRPELFVPGSDGYVFPSLTGSAGGGDTYITVQVAGSVVTERDLVDAVHDGLLRKQRQSGDLGLIASSTR